MLNRSRKACRNSNGNGRRGATTLQVLVLLVPVFFGLMGFAVDLGRLYMIRHELESAANSMALAAASQLIGTDDAESRATSAVDIARSQFNSRQNRYDYNGLAIGDTNGNLASSVDSTFSLDRGTALGGDSTGAGTSTQNRFATVTVTADAPLVFFRFLALGQEGRTTVQARGVAGISAPLCTACGVEPMMVSALNTDDTEDFGFVKDTMYTLGYVCTGPNQPQPLPGATQRIPFLLLDRFTNSSVTSPENAAVRAGAGGLAPDGGAANACIRASVLTATDTAALVIAPLACAPPGNVAQLSSTVLPFVCGLSTRIADGGAVGCDAVDLAGAAPGFGQDTSIDTVDTYGAYTGNMRRIITVAVVQESLAAGVTTATVLGFRQFLIDPSMQPSDQNVRFNALYMGYPMPLKQGTIAAVPDDSGNTCTLTTGPGKVVLQ